MRACYLLACICLVLGALSVQVCAQQQTARYSFDQDADLTDWTLESSLPQAVTARPFKVVKRGPVSTGTNYLAIDSKALRGAGVEERIVSPIVRAGQESAGLRLGFSHFFHHQFDAQTQTQTAGRAEVFDGARWQPVASFGGAAAMDLSKGDAVAPVRESIDISRFANPALRVRFVHVRVPAAQGAGAATGVRMGSWNINNVSVGAEEDQSESVGYGDEAALSRLISALEDDLSATVEDEMEDMDAEASGATGTGFTYDPTTDPFSPFFLGTGGTGSSTGGHTGSFTGGTAGTYNPYLDPNSIVFNGVTGIFGGTGTGGYGTGFYAGSTAVGGSTIGGGTGAGPNSITSFAPIMGSSPYAPPVGSIPGVTPGTFRPSPNILRDFAGVFIGGVISGGPLGNNVGYQFVPGNWHFANTCENGMQDTDEVGVDCGGKCAPCGGNCFDGVKNNGELAADCGGSCARMCLDSNGYQLKPKVVPDKKVNLGAGQYVYLPPTQASVMGGNVVRAQAGRFLFIPPTGIGGLGSGINQFPPAIEFQPAGGTAVGRMATPSLVVGYDKHGMAIKWRKGASAHDVEDRLVKDSKSRVGTSFPFMASRNNVKHALYVPGASGMASGGSGGFFYVPGTGYSGMDGRLFASAKQGVGSGLGFEFLPTQGSGSGVDTKYAFPVLSPDQQKGLPDLGTANVAPMQFFAGKKNAAGVGSGGVFFLPSTGSGASGAGFNFIPGTGASGSSGGHFYGVSQGSGTGAHLGLEFNPAGTASHLRFPKNGAHASHFPALGSGTVAPMQFLGAGGKAIGHGNTKVGSGGVFFQPSTGSAGGSAGGFYFVAGTSSASGDLGHWFMPGTAGTGSLGLEFQPQSMTGSSPHLRFPNLQKNGGVYPNVGQGSAAAPAQYMGGSGGTAGYFFQQASGSGAATGQGFYYAPMSGSGSGAAGAWFTQGAAPGGTAQMMRGQFDFAAATGSGAGSHLHFPKIAAGLGDMSGPVTNIASVKAAMYGTGPQISPLFSQGTGVGEMANGYYYIPAGSAMNSPAPNGYFFVPTAPGVGAGVVRNGDGRYYLPTAASVANTPVGSGVTPFGQEFFPRIDELQYPTTGSGLGSGGFALGLADFFNGVPIVVPPTPGAPTPTPTPGGPTPTPTPGAPTPTPTPTPVPAPIPGIPFCSPLLECAGGNCDKTQVRGALFSLQVVPSYETEDCNINTEPITYTWRVSPQLQGSQSSSTSSVFTVFPFSTVAGNAYTFTVTARVGALSVEKTFNVAIDRTALRASIGCGSSIQASGSTDLELDASGTVDPDRSPTDPESSFTFAWTCTNEGAACVNALTSLPLAEILAPSEVIQVPAGVLAVNNVYVFTLTVSGTGADTRTTSVTQTVTIQPSRAGSSIAGLRICIQGVVRINPASVLRLRATLNSQATDWTYTWTSVASEPSAAVVIDQPNTKNLVLGGNRVFENGQASAPFFTAGAEYDFQIQVSNPAGDTASSSWLVKVNSPPSGGVISIESASDEPQSTVDVITLRSTPFTDAEGDQPVVYQFYRKTALGDIIELNLPGDALEFSTSSIPFGNRADEFRVIVGVRATDYLGESASVETTIRVLPRGGAGGGRRLLTLADDEAYFNAAAAEFSASGAGTTYQEKLFVLINNLNDRADSAGDSALRTRVVGGFATIANLPISFLVAFVRENTNFATLSAATINQLINVATPIPTRAIQEAGAGDGLANIVNPFFGSMSVLLANTNANVAAVGQILSLIEMTYATITQADDLPLGNNLVMTYPGFTARYIVQPGTDAFAEDTKAGSATTPISIAANALSSGEDVHIRLVVIEPAPLRVAESLALAGVLLEITRADNQLVTFTDGVSVTMPFDTARCPQATCIPKCAVFNAASGSLTTTGIASGAVNVAAGTVVCRPMSSTVQIAVIQSSIPVTPPATGDLRIRMENKQVSAAFIGADSSVYEANLIAALAGAVPADASQFTILGHSINGDSQGSFTFIDINIGAQPSRSIFLELQKQAAEETSALRMTTTTQGLVEDAFTEQCADESFNAICAENRSSSSDDSDTGVIVGAAAGGTVGVIALVGGLYYFNKEKTDSDGPATSKQASEQVATSDPATTAAQGEQAV